MTWFTIDGLNRDSVTVGAVGSLVATVLTYMATVALRLRLPSTTRIIFWRRLESGVVATLSELDASADPQPDIGRPYTQTPLDEALALGELQLQFTLRRLPQPKIASVISQTDFDQVKHSNVLLVGGPKFNMGTRSFLKAIDSALPLQFCRLTKSAKQDENDLLLKAIIDRRKPSDAATSRITNDSDLEYGMLIVCRNIFERSRIAVCCAGLNQGSTLAAARLLTQLSSWDLFRGLVLNDGLQILFSCAIADNIVPTNVVVREKLMLRFKRP